ncbi:PAB1 binding protein [Tilletia horrida]|nr:PAB1 binding protein [Tilletia horrida]
MSDKSSNAHEARATTVPSTSSAASASNNTTKTTSSSNSTKRPRSNSHASEPEDSKDAFSSSNNSNGDGPSKRVKEEHNQPRNKPNKMSADNEHNHDLSSHEDSADANGASKSGDKGPSSSATVLSAAATGPSDNKSADGGAGTEDGEGGDGQIPMQMISMRALIITGDASIIIGKQGKHINEIRDKSGARLNISETVAGNPERILTVSGQLDAVSKAFGLIVRRINDEPFEQPSVPGSRAVTIRFIVPNSRMGSVIGKQGSKIKEIQEASGARLTAGEQMLPGSTERVLSISGVADAVHIAVYYVGTILLEHQERNLQNTSYRPSQAGPSQLGARGQGAHSHPRGGPGGYGGGIGAGAGGFSGGLGGAGGAMPLGGGAGGGLNAGTGPLPPGSQTQQIFIPNDLVGSIIGKGGQKINEIRQMSGSHIKIMEPGAGVAAGGTGSERLVMITGPPANIQMAVTLLYQRLEQEKLRVAQQPQ